MCKIKQYFVNLFVFIQIRDKKEQSAEIYKEPVEVLTISPINFLKSLKYLKKNNSFSSDSPKSIENKTKTEA